MTHEQMCQLNRFALDEEAGMSAANLQTYGEQLAKARVEKDSLESGLKTVYAVEELTIRKCDPKAYGLEKFTEGSISALVESSHAVMEGKRLLIEAKERFFTLEALVMALKDKSDQIKNLTSLWIAGYYAEPSNGGNMKKAAMGR